ncbi:MAG: alpha/beta fold hydrolase [Myxococcaceae bacterium]
MSRALLSLFAVLSSSCALTPERIVETVARIRASSGWFEITPKIAIDSNGRLEASARTAAEEDNAEPLTRAQRVKAAYRAQFEELDLDPKRGCGPLTAGRKLNGPVFLLVPGVAGDGVEWWPVIPVLRQAAPAAMFMYRWLAPTPRGAVIEGLVQGVNQLVDCYAEAGPIVLLAHSAGGVISAFAASRFHLPPTDEGHPRLYVLTVASPLAGVGYRERENDNDDTRLINDLGTAQQTYPAAAPGVNVLHYRTQFPADTVMKPNVFGHEPNQRGVGVKGARELDVPVTLGHNLSLLHVARELVAGRGL